MNKPLSDFIWPMHTIRPKSPSNFLSKPQSLKRPQNGLALLLYHKMMAVMKRNACQIDRKIYHKTSSLNSDEFFSSHTLEYRVIIPLYLLILESFSNPSALWTFALCIFRDPNVGQSVFGWTSFSNCGTLLVLFNSS